MREESCETLMAKVDEIKNDIAEALLEIDDINLQINPHIVAEYTVRIGCWENELLRAQIAARRARRKFELAQAAANRCETVDEILIEETLGAEFAQWEEALARQVANLRSVLDQRVRSTPLTAEEVCELKSLHRKLVKRLHPDTHPGQGETERSFFALAQRAYEAGDLETLRSIEVATSSFDQEDWDVGNPTEEDLLLEIELLSAQLEVSRKQLAALKAGNPYALGAKLFDPEWVANTVAALKSSIQEQQTTEQEYSRRFCELTRNAEGEGGESHAA